jgi:hypothetical protein
VVDIESGVLTPGQLTALTRWTRRFHTAVADFRHPGPWRLTPTGATSLVAHNDIAMYNACFDGDELVGVFDWDFAGPSTPLLELAFIEWNGVPLWAPEVPPDRAAGRLELISAGYAGPDARSILHAVPHRIGLMLHSIVTGAAAGDPGLANLVAGEEPERSQRSLAALIERIPAIDAALG